MPFFRLKHSFTAGELSPLMNDRIDFDRYRNGCKILKNMFCSTQGPAVRRSGFKFVYDLNTIGYDTAAGKIRMIPFIFNELQAYVMIFYQHTDGTAKMVLGTSTSADEDGLVLGSGNPCDYDSTRTTDYQGNTDYVYNFPVGAGLAIDTVTHIAADSTRTDIGAGSYSSVWDSVTGTLTLTLTGGPAEAAGDKLELVVDLTIDAILDTEVVTLDLPENWDIDAFDWAQSGDEMYIAQSDLNPHIIRRRSDADAPTEVCWELVSVTFTDQPDDWSDENGWPEKVTFHQQRLVYAANTTRRQTVWMSKAGDFSDFGISSPLVDSDAVTFTLASGTQNKIQWISTGKSLHVGTLGDEWTVDGNDQSALTPSNILARRQTNQGSEPNKPLRIGITTLFVERHGRTVNEFVYDYTFDSYKTSDMAILSPHLTEHYSIIDWTYQQTPDSIIWCVREDGTLLGITYQRQHKVIGWHRHLTDGDFKACSAIPGQTREDDVWAAVLREINLEEDPELPPNIVQRLYIEKLDDWFKSDSVVDAHFLDSFVKYEGEPTDLVGSLNNLVNKEVGVLADGTVHPPVTVDGTGAVRLNNQYSNVIVGLPYESEVRPHLLDADVRDGTSRGRVQRVTNVMIDLYRSLGMYVGRYDAEDGEYEEEIPFRVPGDLMGRAVPLFEGWYELAFPEGFDREIEYFIRQKQPLPLTVRGVVDEVEVQE